MSEESGQLNPESYQNYEDLKQNAPQQAEQFKPSSENPDGTHGFVKKTALDAADAMAESQKLIKEAQFVASDDMHRYPKDEQTQSQQPESGRWDDIVPTRQQYERANHERDRLKELESRTDVEKNRVFQNIDRLEKVTQYHTILGIRNRLTEISDQLDQSASDENQSIGGDASRFMEIMGVSKEEASKLANKFMRYIIELSNQVAVSRYETEFRNREKYSHDSL